MLTLADLGILREVDESTAARSSSRSRRPTRAARPWARSAPTCARRLRRAGYADVEVRTVLHPAWTTDWITAAGRRKLAAAGIAPPRPAPGASRPGSAHACGAPPARSRCPRCGSRRHARDRPRSAPPRARRCTGAARAPSRSSTSRRSDVATDFQPLRVGRASTRSATTPSRSPSTCRPTCATVRLPARPVADRPPIVDGARAPLVLDLRAGRRARRGSACARSPAARSRRLAGARGPGRATTIEVLPPSGSFTPDLDDGRPPRPDRGRARASRRCSRSPPRCCATPTRTVTLLYGNRRSRHGDVRRRAGRPEGRAPGAAASWSTCCPRAAGGRAVHRPPGRREAARPAPGRAATSAGVDHWWLCGPYGMVTRRASACSPNSASRRHAIHQRAVLRRGRAPPPAAHARRRADRPGEPRSRSCSTAARQHGRRPADDADPRRRAAGSSGPAVRLQGRRLRHLPGQGHSAARCTCAATSRSRTPRRRGRLRAHLPVDAGHRRASPSTTTADRVRSRAATREPIHGVGRSTAWRGLAPPGPWNMLKWFDIQLPRVQPLRTGGHTDDDSQHPRLRRRHMEPRSGPHRDRFRCPAHDGVEGSRKVREVHRHHHHRGQPARFVTPRPRSTCRPSRPATTSATGTCAAATSSMSTPTRR